MILFGSISSQSADGGGGDTGDFVTLTIQIDGVETPTVLYNDEAVPSNQLIFPKGTLVEDITPTATGYTFVPASQTVLMDDDKTIVFEAIED